MSENYQQFVAQYIVPEGFNSTDLLRVAYDAALTVVVDDGVDYSGGGEYAGVEIYVSKAQGVSSVYITAEHHGDPAIAVAAILAMQKHCDDNTLHILKWSYTSEVMVSDNFGGGAVGIKQGLEPYYLYPEQEVQEHFDMLGL